VDLQKYPIALLGALGLKVTGRAPPLFSDAGVPSVDVYDQYLAAGEMKLVTTTMPTKPAASNSVTLSVPTSKAWRVIATSVYGSLNAADVALKSYLSVGVQTPSSPLAVLLTSAFDPGGAVARQVGIPLRPPIFLTSGFLLSFGLATSAAITITSTFICAALVQEFDQ